MELFPRIGSNADMESKEAMAKVSVPAKGEMSGTEVMEVRKPERMAPMEVRRKAMTATASLATGPRPGVPGDDSIGSGATGEEGDVVVEARMAAVRSAFDFAERLPMPRRASLSQT